MPKRIAENKIIVHRNGARVVIKPGQLFDFTADELAALKIDAPEAVRTIKNEADTVEEVIAPDAKPKTAKFSKGDKAGAADEL